MNVGILINADAGLEKRLAHLKELGFASCQLAVWDMNFYREENVEFVRSLMEKYGFRISALWCGWSGPADWGYPGMYSTLGLTPAWLRAQRLNELRRGGEFAHALGVDTIITHTGYISDDPLNPDHIAVVQALRLLCSELKARGQRFAFETGEELAHTLRLMIDEVGTGNVYVNFDPANFLINARANPVDAMEMLGDFVIGMHGKDGVYPRGGAPKGREMPLGKGGVDFPALIRMLKNRGYTGDITIEREIPEGKEQDQDILEAKRLLETLIGEA